MKSIWRALVAIIALLANADLLVSGAWPGAPEFRLAYAQASAQEKSAEDDAFKALEELDPEAEVPGAVRGGLPQPLINVWRRMQLDKDMPGAVQMMKEYLGSGTGSRLSRSDLLLNAHAYHLLLARLGMLGTPVDRQKNKGLFWYTQGLEQYYTQKALQARASFVKGVFAEAELRDADFARLRAQGVDVKFDRTMNEYVNSAILASKFMALSLEEKEIMLNVGVGEKIAGVEVVPEDLANPASPSYRLLSLYYNLGAYIIAESNNNFSATFAFKNSGDDLYQILLQKFGFETTDLYETYR